MVLFMACVSATPAVAVKATQCRGVELKHELDGSDIIGGRGAYNAASRTLALRLDLAGVSCPRIAYRLDVYSIGLDLVGSERTTGDGTSRSVTIPDVVLTAYDNAANHDCVTVIAETINATTGAVIDRAPDASTFDFCDGSSTDVFWR